MVVVVVVVVVVGVVVVKANLICAKYLSLHALGN